MFENLAVPVVDHDVEIPLPNGNGNLLSLPIVSFYVSLKDENGDMVFGRQATQGRMIPTNIQAEPQHWMELLRKVQHWSWAGNIMPVSKGSRGGNRYFTKRLRCDLGKNIRKDNKQPTREVMYQSLNILETYPVTTLYYCVQFDDNTQYEKSTITKPAVRKRKSGGNKTVFPPRKRPQNNANVQMGSLGTARRPETGRRRTLGKFCVGNCPVDITISIGRLGRSGNGC